MTVRTPGTVTTCIFDLETGLLGTGLLETGFWKSKATRHRLSVRFYRLLAQLEPLLDASRQ